MITEDFFWEKVDGTLRALAQTPVSPDWGRDLLSQIKDQQGVALVVDLEEESFCGIELLAALRQDPATAKLPVLAYGSHEKGDLLAEAGALGAIVVARSTFASSLVRILQDLCTGGEVVPGNRGFPRLDDLSDDDDDDDEQAEF